MFLKNVSSFGRSSVYFIFGLIAIEDVSVELYCTILKYSFGPLSPDWFSEA
jgi:hypothetical protein